MQDLFEKTSTEVDGEQRYPHCAHQRTSGVNTFSLLFFFNLVIWFSYYRMHFVMNKCIWFINYFILPILFSILRDGGEKKYPMSSFVLSCKGMDSTLWSEFLFVLTMPNQHKACRPGEGENHCALHCYTVDQIYSL